MWRYYGFGAFKIPLPKGATREARIERNKAMLSRVLDLGSTVAVVGAGMSRSLGYPGWQEFTRGIVSKTLEGLRSVPRVPEEEINRLERFHSILTGPKSSSSARLMFFIGACQRALETYGPGAFFLKDHFEEVFCLRKDYPPETINPYEALLELPISRFVTTNYDCEIERALSRKVDIPWSAFGIQEDFKPTGEYPQPLSFTQQGQYRDQLALFNLSDANSNRNMVFHCHGRFDQFDSIIASELDYQKWYIAENNGDGHSFQQTIDLLFRSNPLLFVGYGLKDEDLLRTLRSLGASSPDTKQDKAIFALLASGGASDDDHHEYLFQRYGVHVIPYPKPKSNDPMAWPMELQGALHSCHKDWREIRKLWVSKPAVRKTLVETSPPNPFQAARILEQRTLGIPDRAEISEHVGIIESIVLGEKTKVVALTGDTSRKKTWLALRVFERLAARPEHFDSFFYWSAQFADSAINGIEKFLTYVSGFSKEQGMNTNNLLDRLRNALVSGRHFVVLDGCERLLRRKESNSEVTGYSTILEALIRIITDPESRSTVLFVSQHLPTAWSSTRDATETDPAVHIHEVPSLKPQDLALIPPFEGLEDKRLAALCSLLHGHFYGLLLVARCLERSKKRSESTTAVLERLLVDVGREPQGNRITALLERHLEALDQQTGGAATQLIKRTGTFITPFGQPALEACYELAVDSCTDRGYSSVPGIEELVGLMIDEALIMRVEIDHARDKNFYLVHPTVRSFLFDRYEHSHQGVLPDFGLGGLTSGKCTVWPESLEKWSMEDELFGYLLDEAHRAIDDDQPSKAKELLRRCFSLVRSRMSAIASPNWTLFEDSFRRLLKLLALVKRASPMSWDHVPRDSFHLVEDAEGVLYVADLAWLYNELVLCLEAEGYAADAWEICQQGHDINVLIEGPEGRECLGEYEIQSLLNMTQIAIDRCRFTLAEERLRRAEEINSKIGSIDLAGQLEGYRGLMAIFFGDSKSAVSRFESAIEKLQEAENWRAACYFLGHWASQEAVLGRQEKKNVLMKRAQALAAARQFRDFSLFLQLQEITSKQDHSEARRRLVALLERLEREEMKKQAAAAHSEFAKLSDLQGDFEGSRREATISVAMSNEMGLRSRQLRSLLRLGLATYKSGDRKLGISYMRITSILARRNQYWLLHKDAREQLRQWGIFTDSDELPIPPEYPL